MRRTAVPWLLMSVVALVTVQPASGAVIDLFDWAINVDGTVFQKASGDPLPGAGGLDGSGLGARLVEL